MDDEAIAKEKVKSVAARDPSFCMLQILVFIARHRIPRENSKYLAIYCVLVLTIRLLFCFQSILDVPSN